ncbi:MAG: hypothetical protein IKP17_03845 [Oscillospiraceae bacterium]|nr:hypothetical protein [Oscillospiraceae bacterium]MBR4691871.1 hypothetical protein [Oscillospiraceae bacterium]
MDYYTNPPYYLTAYGLAVKYGYQGTEQEFVDELMNGAAHAAEAASVSAAEALAKAQLAETAAGSAAESAAGALESAAAAASSASAASASAEDAADYAGRIADPVGGLVTGWLEENVDPETGYVIDGSLTVSGAAADALKTGAVRDVTNTLLSGGNVGPAVSVTWSQGGISSSSGSTANNDARIRTSIIRGTAAALSIISVHRVDVLVYAYRYSINSSHYVGAVTTDFVPCPADKRILIPLDKGLAYCVVARYPDDADILPAEGSGITIQKFAMARADSSAAAALLGGDKTLTGFDFSWTSGTLSEASGSENTSERVMRTDFLRIVPGSVLKFVGEGGSSRVAFAYYYDEAKSYIKRVDIVGGDSALVPNNAAYVRLTYGYTTASGETLNDGFAEMPKYKISINEDRTQFILDVLGYLPTTVVKGYIRPSGVIAESTGVSSYPVFELPVGRTVKVKIWGPWKYSVMQGDAANNLKKTHRLVTQSEIEVEHPFVGFTFYKYDENGDPVDADPDDFKNEVVLFLGDRATDSAQLTHDVPENIGVLNVINRAYQMAKLTYTAAADLPTQVNTERYPGYVPAGEKVTGVMYSSVRSEGLYVPQCVSLQTYMTALLNPNSYIYQKTEPEPHYNALTYYGAVCSSMVAWCYGIDDVVPTTISFADYPGMEIIENQSPYGLKLGDMLNYAGSHIAIVTDIVRDWRGRISTIEVTDQVNYSSHPMTRSRRLSPESIQSQYFDSRYVAYRYHYIYKVPYTPSPWVNLDDEAGEPVYSAFLSPRRGEDANWRLGETVEIDVMDAAEYTQAVLEKYDAAGEEWDAVDTRSIPAGLLLSYASLDAGNYRAYLTDGTESCDPVYFDVMSVSVSYAASEGAVAVSFASDMGTAASVSFCVADPGSSDYRGVSSFYVLSDAEIEAGAAAIPHAAGTFLMKVEFKTRFGLYSSDLTSVTIP